MNKILVATISRWLNSVLKPSVINCRCITCHAFLHAPLSADALLSRRCPNFSPYDHPIGSAIHPVPPSRHLQRCTAAILRGAVLTGRAHDAARPTQHGTEKLPRSSGADRAGTEPGGHVGQHQRQRGRSTAWAQRSEHLENERLRGGSSRWRGQSSRTGSVSPDVRAESAGVRQPAAVTASCRPTACRLNLRKQMLAKEC
jgi:hypothetical protein